MWLPWGFLIRFCTFHKAKIPSCPQFFPNRRWKYVRNPCGIREVHCIQGSYPRAFSLAQLHTANRYRRESANGIILLKRCFMNGKYQPGQTVFLTGGNKNLIKEATVLKYTGGFLYDPLWQRWWYQSKRIQDLPFSWRSWSSDPEQSSINRDLSGYLSARKIGIKFWTDDALQPDSGG